ncbi:MAG: hypothetical protein LBJ32_02395 [Oscillospiraceae bacterium]|jgi:hypothetical protein|nr:hypothetical protein [Oscillospiraceae bacterium]
MEELKDILEKYGSRTTYVISVYINGKKFKPERFFLQSLECESGIWSEASICIIRFRCPFLDEIKLPSDISDAKIGVKFKIQAGYEKSGSQILDTIFEGFVHSVGIEIENDYTILIISGMDAKIWMMSSKRTEMKKNKKNFSDIVRATINIYSNKFSGTTSIKIQNDPELTSPIFQRNESDFEFLCRMAKTTGSVFYVSLGKLFFTPPDANKSVKLNISPCNGLFSVNFSVNLFGTLKNVEVKVLDEKDVSKIKITKISSNNTIGSGKTASDLSSNVSGSAEIVNNFATTSSQAKFIAQAEMIRRSFFVKCELKISFFASAELGAGVKIKKIGSPIDNTYIATNIRHVYDGDKNEFFTFLTLQSDSYNPASDVLGSVLSLF